jgi:hypothetical protein
MSSIFVASIILHSQPNNASYFRRHLIAFVRNSRHFRWFPMLLLIPLICCQSLQHVALVDSRALVVLSKQLRSRSVTWFFVYLCRNQSSCLMCRICCLNHRSNPNCDRSHVAMHPLQTTYWSAVRVKLVILVLYMSIIFLESVHESANLSSWKLIYFQQHFLNSLLMFDAIHTSWHHWFSTWCSILHIKFIHFPVLSLCHLKWLFSEFIFLAHRTFCAFPIISCCCYL